MKLVVAYVRDFMAPEVMNRLKELGVPGMSAIDVKEVGSEISKELLLEHLEVSGELDSTYTRMVKIEMVLSESEVEKVVKEICGTARTGKTGDGIVSVVPVDEVTKIRNGEKITE